MKRATKARKAKPVPVAPAAKAAGGQRRAGASRSDWWTELRPKLIAHLRGPYATPDDLSAKPHTAEGIADVKGLARIEGSAPVEGSAHVERFAHVEGFAYGEGFARVEGIADAKGIVHVKGIAHIQGTTNVEVIRDVEGTPKEPSDVGVLPDAGGIPDVEGLADGFRPGYAAMRHLGGRIEGIRVLFGPDDKRSTKLCFLPTCALATKCDTPESYTKQNLADKDALPFLRRQTERNEQWHRFVKTHVSGVPSKCLFRISFSAEFFFAGLPEELRRLLKNESLLQDKDSRPYPEFEALARYHCALQTQRQPLLQVPKYDPIFLEKDSAPATAVATTPPPPDTHLVLKPGSVPHTPLQPQDDADKQPSTDDHEDGVNPFKTGETPVPLPIQRAQLQASVFQYLGEHFNEIDATPWGRARELEISSRELSKLVDHSLRTLDAASLERFRSSAKVLAQWMERDPSNDNSRNLYDAIQQMAGRELAPPTSQQLRELRRKCGSHRTDSAWTRYLNTLGLHWLPLKKNDPRRADIRMLRARLTFFDREARHPSKRELRDEYHALRGSPISDRHYPRLLQSAHKLFKDAGLSSRLRRHRSGNLP